MLAVCGQAMTISGPASVGGAFQWSKAVRLAAEQSIAGCMIQRSALLAGPGTDTEFSGGACGWETAAKCLSASFLEHGYHACLSPLSACEPKSKFGKNGQSVFFHSISWYTLLPRLAEIYPENS